MRLKLPERDLADFHLQRYLDAQKVQPGMTVSLCFWPGRIGNRQVRRAVARRGIQRRTPLKMGKLVTPRVTWPPFDAGLSMELAGTTPEGVQLFRYVHSTAYRVGWLSHPKSRVILPTRLTGAGLTPVCMIANLAIVAARVFLSLAELAPSRDPERESR